MKITDKISALEEKIKTLEEFKEQVNAIPRDSINANSVQTLSRKVLKVPLIDDFTNALHDHSVASAGGSLGDTTIANLIVKSPWADVRAYGAVGDGVTDDTTAFQNALNSITIKGGIVYVPPGQYLIDNNLTIKKYATLLGILESHGAVNATGTYSTISQLALNSTMTITMEDGSTIHGVLIYRKGMTLPAVDSSLFAGTAITIGGEGCSVVDSMIIGFDKLIYSINHGRLSVRNLTGDGQNGIEINNSNDIARLDNVHLWPFTTFAGGNHKRTGKGFFIHDTTTGDWTKLTNCFAFGYYEGFNITNSTGVICTGCGADQVAGHTNSLGFKISGSSTLISLISCLAGGQDFAGYYLNGAGNHIQLIGCQAWQSTSQGIAIDGIGNVSVLGGYINSTTFGVYINNASPTIMIDGVRFNTISNKPIYIAIANPNVYIGTMNDYTNFSGNPVYGSSLKDVASAATVTLSNQGDTFNITGITSITSITASWAGRRVTLKFADILTLTDGINLKLAGNFITTADDAINLVCDGTNWYEVSRSIN